MKNYKAIEAPLGEAIHHNSLGEEEIKEKLERRDASLQNIHEALGSGAWEMEYNTNGEMTVCTWSDTLRHMLGFESTEDFPNKFESWSERLHPEDAEYTLREFWGMVADYSGKKTYDVEYRACNKKEEYHWFRAAGRVTRRPDGTPISSNGVFINIDEIHEANEKLHKALQEAENARNELVVEHEIISAVSKLYFSIFTIDLAQDFYEEISSDDSIHRLTGHEGRAQKKMNERCNSIVAEEYQNAVMQFFNLSTLAERLKEVDTIEMCYCAKDGNWHEARFIEKKRDVNGKVTRVLYVTRNVSGQKQQELEQERLQIAYKAAESANEAKTTFLYNMSHDIRTPMNAILGYTQLMKKELHDPKQLHYQDVIEHSGNLLLSIINNVLDMARIESGKMTLNEDYDKVGDIVGGVCKVFEAEAKKKNIILEHKVQVEHPHIIIDTTKIQEIFTNLLSNAIKYTPANGKVTVTIQELPCEREGYVLMKSEVTDTGIGMSKDFLPTLFDSFSRERNETTNNVLGTGLGMAIVKSLVDLMNGTIEVESELGKGTKFTIIISHKMADAVYYEKNFQYDMVKRNVDFSGKHVLLAEDNDLNAEIAIAILEEAGFHVDRAEDGIVCVNRLEQEPYGTYDLILMDIQMPNMDGYKATQIIRRFPDKEKAKIPIIAMTANAFSEDRQKALEAGMNGHIAKPIELNKLMETLAEILR